MTRRKPDQYNWSKLEFDEQLLKKHFTRMKTFEKKYIVIHHMTIVGSGTGSALDACYKTWQNREASAHYGVDGELVRQFVYDKDYAWSTGNTYGNLYGISIECANRTRGPKWEVAEDTMQTAARLAAQIHIVYKFGRPTSNSNGSSGTLRQHDTFTSTACPGPYLGGTEWNRFVKMVQQYYDQIKNGDSDMPLSDEDLKKIWQWDGIPVDADASANWEKNPYWQPKSVLAGLISQSGKHTKEIERQGKVLDRILALLEGETSPKA